MKRAATEQPSAQNSSILQRASQGSSQPSKHSHGKLIVNHAAINRLGNQDELGCYNKAGGKQQMIGGSIEAQKKQRCVQKNNDESSIGNKKKCDSVIEEEKDIDRLDQRRKNRYEV